MKTRLWRWIAPLAVVATLAALAPLARAQYTYEMRAVEKRVPVGITFINHNGQVFRIATPVSLNVVFTSTSTSLLKIEVVAAPGATSPNPAYGTKVSVYWVTWDTDLYEGGVPTTAPWETTVNTEGGFIDR